MKSHCCLQWIDKTIIFSIYLFFPCKNGYFQDLMTTLKPGGKGPHLPSHFEDCPLATVEEAWAVWSVKDHDCQHNGDDRAQQAEHMPGNEGFLHMWPLPSQVSAVPFLGLPHMSPSSSSHIMIYILKTNHFSTGDKNCCNKVIATYFSLHFVYWDKLIKRHKHRACLHGHYNKHIH